MDADADLAEIIGDYDAIVIRSATKLDADLIERAERLKVIGRAGVGVDNVDVDAATRRGIVVANAPESTVVSAAEHTIGLLARARAQHPAGARRAQGGPLGALALRAASSSPGRRSASLGFGRIGQQVARRALGLGMRVVAYDPFVGAERFRELGVEPARDARGASSPAPTSSRCTAADRRDTPASSDAEAIAKMRDGVRIVNAARGELVDEEALAEALRSGKVAGAALDVFSTEPYCGPAARARQRRRHAAPRRLDRARRRTARA